MTVERTNAQNFDIEYPVVIVGGGACGMCAALAARDSGVETLILERDKTPLGTTAMSTGLIPAAGTIEQADQGIDDNPERFTSDIMSKTKGDTDEAIVRHLATESAETITWLRGRHGIGLNLIDGFLYPGHTAMRMYGMPNRSGSELMGALTDAVNTAGADILTNALVTDLIANEENSIIGVRISRPDGETEEIGCQTLILACCGFAGEPTLVEKYTPSMKKAVFHGHPGNKGDAILWGEALGAKLADMGSYQGHGGLAAGHGIPILWPLIMEGGFQVNNSGERFSDESLGYSEQAEKVLAQPGGVAWSIYDARLHELMQSFDDYQDAMRAGAIVTASDLDQLADEIGVNATRLKSTIGDIESFIHGEKKDAFKRSLLHSMLQRSLALYSIRKEGLSLMKTHASFQSTERPFPTSSPAAAPPEAFLELVLTAIWPATA